MPAAYLACGKIAPEHEGLELSVGGSAISAAIREATGAHMHASNCSTERNVQSNLNAVNPEW